MSIHSSFNPAFKSNPGFAPDWQAPPRVNAFGTLRQGGVSQGVYDSFNLGSGVGDEAASVLENRRRLLAQLNGVRRLFFVKQVHGNVAVLADDSLAGDDLPSDSLGGTQENLLLPCSPPVADALVTRTKGIGLVILTADCLPVFFASSDGLLIGVAHAGWRGLAAGVLESTVTLMRRVARERGTSEKIIAAFGPAIGPQKFEVGSEVRAAFLDKKNSLAELFFKPGAKPGKYLANLYGLASLRLGLIDVDVAG